MWPEKYLIQYFKTMLKLSSPLRTNPNDEDKENTLAGQGISTKSRAEENKNSFATLETTFQSCSTSTPVQTDGKINNLDNLQSNTLGELCLKKQTSLFEEDSTGSDILSPEDFTKHFLCEDNETVVEKGENCVCELNHCVKKDSEELFSDTQDQTSSLNSTYSLNVAVDCETSGTLEVEEQKSVEKPSINTSISETAQCCELLQSDSSALNSTVERNILTPIHSLCESDAIVNPNNTFEEEVNHNESEKPTDECVPSDLTSEKDPPSKSPVLCETISESLIQSTEVIVSQLNECSDLNSYICETECIEKEKSGVSEKHETSLNQVSLSNSPENIELRLKEKNNVIPLILNESRNLEAPDCFLDVIAVSGGESDIPNHNDNCTANSDIDNEDDHMIASLTNISCADNNSSSGDIDKTTIILVSDDSNSSLDPAVRPETSSKPTDNLDGISEDVSPVESTTSVSQLAQTDTSQTNEYMIDKDEQIPSTNSDLILPVLQEVKSIEIPSNTSLESDIPVDFENVIVETEDLKKQQLQQRDSIATEELSGLPLKTKISGKEMEMTVDKYQQEISDLKLELNASKQTISSLELEMAKKDEIILKIQAESMKKEQQIQQDLKLLKEQLKEKTTPDGKDSVKELEEALKEAKNKESQAINARMNDEQNYREMMEQYDKTIANCISDSQKVREENETLTRHLANLELSFSDLLQKYERTKVIIDGFKSNESKLRKKFAVFEETFRKQDEKYESLKAHAKAQIEKANKENIQLREKNDSEIIKLNAIVKRLEIKSAALETSLEQKTKECVALAALCDEVTGKKV